MGEHEKFILGEFERGTGAREIYPCLDQRHKVRCKNIKEFSGRNRNFKWFFRSKTGNLQKKGLPPKNVTKTGVSPQKTLIWASICAPKAPSLLISSGHSPRLGGTIFVWGAQAVSWGGTAPVCPAVAPGLGRSRLGKHLISLNSNSSCSTNLFTYAFSSHLVPRSPVLKTRK